MRSLPTCVQCPTWVCFLTTSELPTLTTCTIDGLDFNQYEKWFHPQIDKTKSHRLGVKKIYSHLSIFCILETQKKCKIFL